jgi:hypothetical protein
LLAVAIVIVAVLADVTASSGPLISRILSADAVVDGRSPEWPTLDFVTKQVAVGVANGPDLLHIAVATSDPDVRQRMMSAGVILYLDRTGGKKQTFGIRVPALGRPLPGLGPATPRLTYVEVLGPGKDQRRLVEQDTTSWIRAAVGNQEGTLFLEFAIPLVTEETGRDGLVLGVRQSVIGLGLITPDPPRNAAAPGEGRVAGGRIGGGGGRGGPPGGGMPPPGRPDVGKAVKSWTTVALAAPR